MSASPYFLLIPHAPTVDIRTRAGELGRALAARGCRVEIYRRNTQPKELSIPAKALWHSREILRGVRTEPLSDRLHSLTLPTWHRPGMMQRTSDRIGASLLTRRKPDFIWTSAFGGPVLRASRDTRVIYDLVDDHETGWARAGRADVARLAGEFMKRQMDEAALITVSSLYLQDLARERFGRESVLVPNGADVTATRAAARRPRPERPLSIGYVGGLDYFVRIDWVVEAVGRLRREGINLTLTVVGDGPAVRDRNFPEWVDLAGFRPASEIPSWLDRFDAGIIPFELSEFTHAALPLKALEYGAARLPVVSSPLEELTRRRLPWIRFADPGPDAWTEALRSLAAGFRWEPAWDAMVDEFDWERIAAAFLDTLEEAR